MDFARKYAGLGGAWAGEGSVLLLFPLLGFKTQCAWCLFSFIFGNFFFHHFLVHLCLILFFLFSLFFVVIVVFIVVVRQVLLLVVGSVHFQGLFSLPRRF
jgi:hypothetical protein